MCVFCAIDGWYEDQNYKDVIRLAASILLGDYSPVHTGDVYIGGANAESWNHKDETDFFYISNQCESEQNFQGVKLVEQEMAKIMMTMVNLAEKNLPKDDLERASMRTFIESFKMQYPYMMNCIENRFNAAIEYIRHPGGGDNYNGCNT